MVNYQTYVGTYTDDTGDGIYHCKLIDGEMIDSRLAATVENPSFVAAHPHLDVLYAVNEVDDGSVTAFEIRDDGELDRLDELTIGPADPCYCSVDSTGSALLVAHYSGGAVSVLSLTDDGRLDEPTVVEHEGSSVHPERQTEPHPHAIVPGPNDEYAYVPDLGTDEVLVYSLDPDAGTLERYDVVSVHDGAGPRHLEFDRGRGRAYLVNELDSTMSVFDWSPDAGELEIVQTIETREGGEGENFPADVHVHPSGEHVYASNRGHDSIAVLECSDEELTLLETVSTAGEWPRNFALSPTGDHLFVANEHSDTIVFFAVDDDGRLAPTGGRLSVPQPVCIEIVARS
ncbi:lactonase family protein [Natrarchaeobius oligotrophus]|uniref:Lactonase family protein n=1 Tax=Natrarchaeobius chitinivorans TaxID=1679083 RepID=A0A3N6N144_NATCH|nr:lactonase family protein [Natrarchaeobius chitinivorans]RQH02572.1 lactonase family protein [Natrarchaeobius chitinivorans]